MIAAMMTASNLGARVTGWGFVVFAIGSLGWITVAVTTDQSNLLLTNAFLTLVNLVGIWRWLGRRATYDQGARAAAEASESAPAPRLFQIGGVEGLPVLDRVGEPVGQVVDAMGECDSGRIAYFVVREGGTTTLQERLHAVPWADVSVDGDGVKLSMSAAEFADLDAVTPDEWPVRVAS